jgi:phosphopantothenoylcysteine decarboxylase/phosphopantothenate--cysteine ligase
MLRDRKILLAVTGGIAAYKACELARLLMKNGAAVQVVMTAAAQRFITPLTFEAITGGKAAADLFTMEYPGGGHLDLVRGLDLMVIAPATANCIGKLAVGLADDLVSTAALALKAPLLICPAMNPRMYAHPAVQTNLKTLIRRGVQVLEPDEGLMAHPLEEPGRGRLPEPAVIFKRICEMLPPKGRLSGVTVTVTAGPTREALDPVRFISNFSSGRMGFALAQEARARGANVHLITGPTHLETPPGVDVVRVESVQEMLGAVEKAAEDSQILIMAAAPGDFRARRTAAGKIKKNAARRGLTIELEPAPDILQALSVGKGGRIHVGFALETEDGEKNAAAKLREKKLDLIVLNHPRPKAGAGMGEENIQMTLLEAGGRRESLPLVSKQEAAGMLLDRIERLWTSGAGK